MNPDLKKAKAENKALREDILLRKLARENRALAGVKNSYDAVQPTSKNTKRRTVFVDTAEETGATSRQLKPYDRLLAVAMVRDAVRNFSYAKSILKQIRLNVIGSHYKVQISDPSAQSAQDWFNNVYARNCDFRSDLHICDMWGLALESVIRDGDCGQMIDLNLAQTGKLVYFEADQICDLDTKSMADNTRMAGLQCQDGILRDANWREVGYVLSPRLRGRTSVSAADNPYIAWRDADDFTLLRMPWRFNQGRGVSELMASVNDLIDVYEMRAKELQSAKVAASMAGQIKRREPTGNADNPMFDPDYTGTDTPGTAPTASEEQTEPANYENLETLTGGFMEYMHADDTFELFRIDRPNVNMNEFIAQVVQTAGTSLGMAKCYATLEASASYTAFRGEMVMTWVAFEFLQKWVERYIQDWTAIRAIRWAVQAGKCQAPAAGWESSISWTHPIMPAIDEAKEQDGLTKAMKNGQKDLTDLLGPNWKPKIDKLGEQLKYAREKGVPLSANETVAGAVIPDGSADNNSNAAKGTGQ
jgi:capsid protein